MALCPECENILEFDADEIEEGEVVTCAECDSSFEIVSTEPLELTRLVEDEDEDEEEGDAKEDDDDDDDDEDDYE